MIIALWQFYFELKLRGDENKMSSIEEYSKVIEFWKSFFPEVKDYREVKKIVKDILGINIEKAAMYREENKQKKGIKYKYFTLNVEDSNLSELNDEIQKEIQWIYFFEPIISCYFKIYYNKLLQKKCLRDVNVFVKNILVNLYKRLVNMSYRMLVMETNIASEEGRLLGNTSIERGAFYSCKLLRNKEYLSEIYDIYPELIRLLDNHTKNYFNYVDEILSNIEKISVTRNFIDGKIKTLQIGQGDTHNKGRSVVKILLEDKTFYYKPRTLCMEKKYIELQKWLEKNNTNYHKMKCCKVLDFQTFGIMEKVENTECYSRGEVKEFYYKMGQLLCILYTLNSKDFHCENLVADGKFPVLIDLETLLHVSINDTDYNNIILDVNEEIQNSVIGTSLLPTLLPNMNTEEVIEVGGMGKGNKQSSPFKTQIIKEVNADDIRIEFVNKELPFALNFPKFDSEIIGCAEYLQEIQDGFSNLYIWIEKNKNLYIHEVTKLFSGEKCRAILKNTNIYTQLLETGYHPDVLHNEWDRKIYFCRLGLLFRNEKSSKFLPLYRDEYNEMLNGDVPIYNIDTNGYAIYNASGNEIYEIRKTDTVMQRVKKKIDNMGKCDYQRQISLINHSFIGCKIKTNIVTGTDVKFSNKLHCDKRKNVTINCAKQIGDLCAERGVKRGRVGQTEIMWIGMRGFGEEFYKIVPVGLSLYQGNCGIALFYFLLYKKSRQEMYKDVAGLAFSPIKKFLQQNKYEDMEGIGAFTGLTSYVYTLLYLYNHNMVENVDAKMLSEIINKSIGYLKKRIHSEDNMDLLSGIAGILGVFLSAHKIIDGEKKYIWTFITELVNILLDNLIRVGDSCITWHANGDIGYAHGNAGIVSQLARYYKITHDGKVKETIKCALNYERKIHFNSENEIWIFRKNIHYFSWCNGVAGLLLEKIILLQCGWNDSMIKQEILILIEQLKEKGFGTDTSICHGDMGSIQILTYVGWYLKKADLYSQCLSTKEEFLEWFLAMKLNDYVYLEDWGLMTGITGIGMALISDSNEIFDLLSLM